MIWNKLALFAGGALFGSAGIKLLTSKDAKKAYVRTTVAALRAKECVMTTVTCVKENAEDIYAEAQQINAERAVVEVEDEAEACVEEAAEETAE